MKESLSVFKIISYRILSLIEAFMVRNNARCFTFYEITPGVYVLRNNTRFLCFTFYEITPDVYVLRNNVRCFMFYEITPDVLRSTLKKFILTIFHYIFVTNSLTIFYVILFLIFFRQFLKPI